MNPFTYRFFSETPLIAQEAIPALADATIEPMAAEHPVLKQMRERMKPQMRMDGDVAIIPIEGVMARRPSVWELLMGVEDTDNVLGMVNAAASDTSARSAVLDINSPGGFLTGGPEVADAVRRMKRTKPCVAWTGGSMASLAYWIGSAANEIVATRSASVGSIGVYTAFIDFSMALAAQGIKLDVMTNKEGSPYKGMGLRGTSLTDEQRQFIKARMQETFEDFKADVLRERPEVPEDAMRGQSFVGNRAKEKRLVDRIGDLPFAISLARQLAK